MVSKSRAVRKSRSLGNPSPLFTPKARIAFKAIEHLIRADECLSRLDEIQHLDWGSVAVNILDAKMQVYRMLDQLLVAENCDRAARAA